MSEIELWITTELTLARPVTRLTAVPQLILNLEGVRTLDFTAHPITALPPAIGRLQSLKRLVLISLYLQELPAELCEIDLEQLFICGCHIHELPAGIVNWTHMHRFYVDSNRLTQLPELLPPNIDGLKASGNRLERLPDSVGLCTKIHDILAYGNRLTTIPESVCQLENLRHLCLHGNRLCAIPENIGQIRSLESLLLADNMLEHLPNSVAELQWLHWLYVYNNKLAVLPPLLMQGCARLERLLVEANPLSGEAVRELLGNIPKHTRVVGVDDDHLEHWHRDGGGVLPNCVVSGRMLPWGPLYAKLTPSWGLSRAGARHRRAAGQAADVLVVAFSASQGEPEWAGVLGQVFDEGGGTVEQARARIRRAPKELFHDLHVRVHGEAPHSTKLGSTARASAALWHDFCGAAECAASELPPPTKGSRLHDCDVLFLVDTGVQWYCDVPEQRLEVEDKLTQLAALYQRVFFLGVSMGGFGALSHAHLADTVVVFGPQTNLCVSHLRPGFLPAELAAASARLRENVRRALVRGTRIEYHVATEDHLVQAKFLPLPPGALVVHPVACRIARFLDKNGILVPLLTDLIGDLQEHDRGRVASQSETFALENATADDAWDWSDAEHAKLTVAKWGALGGMSLLWITPSQLALVARDAPRVGDWFCSACCARNDEGTTCCTECYQGMQTQRRVAQPSVVSPPKPPKTHTCAECGEKHQTYARNCQLCGGSLNLMCEFCKSIGSREDGKPDLVCGVWYCSACWGRFRRHSAALRAELPSLWFVEGGQLWSWATPGPTGAPTAGAPTVASAGARQHGTIEFDKHGKLFTTWGDGQWWLDAGGGGVLQVSFGRPVSRRWRLVRVPGGFLALRGVADGAGDGGAASRGVAVVQGQPMYGVPLSRAPLLSAALWWMSAPLPRRLLALRGRALLALPQLRRRGARSAMALCCAVLAALAVQALVRAGAALPASPRRFVRAVKAR